jgi:hypothetical protein
MIIFYLKEYISANCDRNKLLLFFEINYDESAGNFGDKIICLPDILSFPGKTG